MCCIVLVSLCLIMMISRAFQVVLYLNGIEEFPKDDAKGQKWREAYRRFLAEAGAGINEKALVVKALK